jgi:hypothetical protein
MNLLGLFEIDEAGTILYARADPEHGTEKSGEVMGKNFFELAPPQTGSDLQQKIHRFINSSQQADSFYLLSSKPDGSERVKVLLGRIRHRAAGDTDTSVLVHLRKV